MKVSEIRVQKLFYSSGGPPLLELSGSYGTLLIPVSMLEHVLYFMITIQRTFFIKARKNNACL